MLRRCSRGFIAMTLTLLLTLSVSAAQNITINLRDNRPVDVIITGQSGAFDAQTIEASVKNALVAQGVDPSRIWINAGELTSISSAGAGAREILDTWTVFPEGAPKGEMLGPDMMRGPVIKGPSGQFHPTMNSDADIDIDFSYSTTCQPYSPAVLLRWNKNTNGTYTGYYVGMSTNHSHAHAWNAMPMLMYIWKSDGNRVVLGDAWTIGGTATQYPSGYIGQGENPPFFGNTSTKIYTGRSTGLVAWHNTQYKTHGIFRANSGADVYGCGSRENLANAPKFQYHVTMKGNTISFDLKVTQRQAAGPWVTSPTYNLTWTDSNPIKSGSVGFFAHNSNAVGISAASFQLYEMNDLIETIRSPAWRPNSHRFILDATQEVRSDLSNTVMVGELMERMAADEAYYIGWGTAVTQASVAQFIQRNDGRGKFVQGGSPFVDIAKYIEPIVNAVLPGKDDAYLIKEKAYDFTTN